MILIVSALAAASRVHLFVIYRGNEGTYKEYIIFKFRRVENVAKMGRNLERRTGGIVANVNG
jgi:hypothetical protein